MCLKHIVNFSIICIEVFIDPISPSVYPADTIGHPNKISNYIIEFNNTIYSSKAYR